MAKATSKTLHYRGYEIAVDTFECGAVCVYVYTTDGLAYP